MRWFFLASFAVGIALCGFVLSVICLALATRIPGEWLTVVVVLTPFLVLFAWATREMLRAFRQAGRKPPESLP